MDEQEESHHITSQRHKKPPKDYSINPLLIPRPSSFNEVYQTEEKDCTFNTTVGVNPPFSGSFFKVNEVENSSCRLIRSSMNKIPITLNELTESNLVFGLYLSPFTELPEEEAEKIPQITISENDGGVVGRCPNCKAYLNSKFKTVYDQKGAKLVECNICLNKSDIFSSYSDIVSPTVDYIIKKVDDENFFYPRYFFLFDTTTLNYENGYVNYVINSIQSSLDYFNNVENSYVAFATYNDKSINYFYQEKEEVKCIKVIDVNSPFCPIEAKKLFLSITNQRDILEKIIEKIVSTVTIENPLDENNNIVNPIYTSATGAAIISGINALVGYGGRVMCFTGSPCLSGYEKIETDSQIAEKNKNKTGASSLNGIMETKKEEPFDDVIKVANENRIVVDQFFLCNLGRHTGFNTKETWDKFIRKFSRLSNETGGHFNFYSVDLNLASTSLKSIVEKIHYDLTSIVQSNNYYDTRFMIRYSKGIDCYEIIGQFNNKIGEAFQLGGCSKDTSFTYLFRIDKSGLKNEQPIHFQVASLYIDNFSQEKLRIINYTVIATNNQNSIYSCCDSDVLPKITLMREISQVRYLPVDDLKNNQLNENLYKRILNSFRFYRIKGAKDRDPTRLILPSTQKFFPIYLHSFAIKLKIFKVIKTYFLFDLYQKLMATSVEKFIKFFYPRLYRIDDIQNDQKYVVSKGTDPSLIAQNMGYENSLGIIQKPYMLRLSKDCIDFDSSYLVNDGEYISMYVFNSIQYDFYQHIFNLPTWSDCVEENVNDIFADDNIDLNVRIRNIIEEIRNENEGKIQPLRIYFLNENNFSNICLSQYLLEDEYESEKCYVDELCRLHKDIQKDIEL